MKKFIFLDSKEALFLLKLLNSESILLGYNLSHPDLSAYSCIDEILNDMDLCDHLKKKISKVFSGLLSD